MWKHSPYHQRGSQFDRDEEHVHKPLQRSLAGAPGKAGVGIKRQDASPTPAGVRPGLPHFQEAALEDMHNAQATIQPPQQSLRSDGEISPQSSNPTLKGSAGW